MNKKTYYRTNEADTRGGWSYIDQIAYEHRRYQEALQTIRKLTRNKKIIALIDKALEKSE